MSDTQIELQAETVPAPRKARRSPSSPPAEPAAETPPAEEASEDTASSLTESVPDAAVPMAPVATASAATPRPRRARPPKAGGFPWEVSPLAQFPMAELLAEIDRRHARARMLIAERQRILAQMAALEAEMGMVQPAGASAAPTRRPAPAEPRQRARNSVSLADALALAIEVRATVSPAEAAQLVLSNGYQSTAKNFGVVVANALAKDQRFKRVERGRHERV